MSSFAWGLAPSSARAYPPLAKLGGCTMSDLQWQTNLRIMKAVDSRSRAGTRSAASLCRTQSPVTLVPRLLLRELVVSVARRLLPNTSTILTVPRVTVHSASISEQSPPLLWMVTLTVCFPCDGTPVARCVHMTAILDAAHPERSRVMTVTDAGVVPAEEAVSGGTLPFNARTSELSA